MKRWFLPSRGPTVSLNTALSRQGARIIAAKEQLQASMETKKQQQRYAQKVSGITGLSGTKRYRIKAAKKVSGIAGSTENLDDKDFMGSSDPGSFFTLFADLPVILTADFPRGYNKILNIGSNTTV